MTGPSQLANVAAAVLKPKYFKKSLLLADTSLMFSSLKILLSTGIFSTNSLCLDDPNHCFDLTEFHFSNIFFGSLLIIIN